ncbi:MAG TPA: CpsB/CapC family capsule biosynthesis tyrosine phosphatase [Gemmatimonadales bacterium]|nr:CpsB/CapC family capsule biosynthesis tyrosine phosphatase [Gemmatimonadales bacterium]
MIDLHSHLLPGVDDGSRSVSQSVSVLTRLADAGVTDVCLTPHLTVSAAELGVPPAYDAAFRSLTARAPELPRLHRGVELMLDRPFTRKAIQPGITLAGTRYVLVEFTRIVPASTVQVALTQVVECGLVPLLAHPERYSSCSPRAVEAWREAGALMQLDATTVLTGSARGDRARALLAAGLGDILAADNHGDSASQEMASRVLRGQGAEVQAELLTVTNPQAILDDRATTRVEPVTLSPPLTWRLRRFLNGGER